MKAKKTNPCQERGRNFFWGALLIVGIILPISAVSHSRTNKEAGHFRTHLLDKLDTVLDQLDATDEQRKQSEAIAADLAEYSDHFEAVRRDLSARLAQALSRKEIDVVAFAEIRLEMLELTDEASAKLFDALFDLSELLTPAQRAKLLDLVREHS